MAERENGRNVAAVSDAWVYARDGAIAAPAARQLAELGYAPRHLPDRGRLRPDSDGYERPPRLALVVAPPGEHFQRDAWTRLRAEPALEHVPLVVAMDPDQLEQVPDLAGSHELLVRPFTTAELHARIRRARALLAAEAGDGDVVRLGSLEVDLATYETRVGGRTVPMTHMEQELLRFLATHPGRAYSRDALLSAVWGYDYVGGARTVDVHVRRLRAKLGPEHAGRIRTVRGVGYLMNAA
jgi:DNA-binding response OmpR family regulator